MLPSAEIFDPGRTHCPSCNATQPRPDNRCEFCGFTASIAVQRYPFEPPELERILDPDAALRPGQRRALDRAIRRFEKRLPQVHVSVCVMTLPEGVDGREFGYWFFNRSPARTREAEEQRKHCILLLVDQRTKSVSATVGYALDSFLDDPFLHRTFERAEPVFKRRGFVDGICRWLRVAIAELGPICEDANYVFERWARHNRRSSKAPPAITEGFREVVESPSGNPVQRLPRPATREHESSEHLAG